MLQTESEDFNADLTDTASPRSGHNFSRIAIRPTREGAIQAKLAINKPGDEYEQEADYVAEQVMRMPEPHPQRACVCGGECPKCRAQRAMTMPASATLNVQHLTVKRAQARPELLETSVLNAQAISATTPEASVQPELTIGNQAESPSSIQRQTESLADQGDCSGWESDCESFCIRAAKQYWLDVDGVQPPAVKHVDCSTPLFGPDGKPRLGPCIVSFEGGLRVSVGRPLDKSAKNLEIWRTRPTGSTSGYVGPSCKYEYHCATKDNSLILTQVSCHEYQPQLPKQEQEESKISSPVQRQSAYSSSFSQVPPIVAEVLNSPGQPLDPATSTFMESRFGHDFSQVRVHTDSRAARSAKAIDARAYTAGRNIVFGAGQFQPATQMGRQLLAHELTHVVQQRRSPVPVARGLGISGNFHERQAGAVGDALMRGGDIAGLLGSGSGPTPSLQRDTPQARAPSPAQPTTAPPPPPRPLDYDRAARRQQAPLDPAVTKDQITKLLNDKVNAGEIASFAVKGVLNGSTAEIFLLAVIYQLGNKTRWGTEADIVTAIGWPAKPGAPPPLGQVTVRIDSRGAATAELIAAGPVPAVAQTTVAAGSAKLIADFGFVSVTGWGDTPKDAAEISDVLGALELLKSRAPQDISALKGVELIRVPSLGGNTAGEFSVGGRVSAGSTAPSKPSLKLADSAFDANTVQFFGGGPGSPPVPASFQVILHEVGHAVEREEFRLAQEAYVKAAAERDVAQQRLKDYDATYEADYKEAKSQRKLGRFYKRREAEHKRLEAAVDKASARARAEADKIKSTEVTASTVQAFETAAAAMSTSAANSLIAAKSAVQALRPDEVQSSAAYVKSIEDTAAAITSFAVDAKAGRDAIDDLELVVFQKVFDRDRAEFELFRPQPPRGLTHRAIIPLGPAVQAQDAWFEAERVLAWARQRTRRVQKFIDLVTANNIRRFTEYSVENWQLKPGEFYAEAYSLWLVDPEFLKNNYKVVYDFFQSGDYRR